ncbi:MAG: hypothetical protein ACK4X1_04485 [Terricaulis sp.]
MERGKHAARQGGLAATALAEAGEGAGVAGFDGGREIGGLGEGAARGNQGNRGGDGQKRSIHDTHL